jgi:hypothetical protein
MQCIMNLKYGYIYAYHVYAYQMQIMCHPDLFPPFCCKIHNFTINAGDHNSTSFQRPGGNEASGLANLFARRFAY